MTLALLPLIVQMVITLVNGNLGAGIAVMGVNSTWCASAPFPVRRKISAACFRPWPSAATGMGFLGLAVVFTVVVAVVNLMFVLTPFGKPASRARRRASPFRKIWNTTVSSTKCSTATPRVGADRGDDYQHGQPLPADLPAPPARAGLRKR